MFLQMDIKETTVPFVANHPFTSSWYTMLDDGRLVDLHDKDVRKQWRSEMSEHIDEVDLMRLFVMLDKKYILLFLRFVAKHMNNKDLGRVLRSFWQSVESISLDADVSGETMTSWFKRADKSSLMDSEGRAIYDSLPDTVTLYRGVTSINRRKTKALSWTTDREVAKWFAERFNTGTGEIWMIRVPKERILCVFKHENEVIVDLYRYKNAGDMLIERLSP